MSNTYPEEADRLELWVIKNSNWLAVGIIAAAFAIRLAYAGSCYLNPDEAEHFGAARPASWFEAYRAALMLAHPPLFILILHGLLVFGRTELILRLPSLAGGTAALGLAFAWLRRSLGKIAALAGLGFMAIAPVAITASTEVRQYGLLLCFVCGSLYATERAFSERSTIWAIVQALFLTGALLTNYTTIIVLGSLGLYVVVRLLQGDMPRRFVLTMAVNQFVLAALLGGLYVGHIRRASVFNPSGSLNYLGHYFYAPGSETLLGFVWRSLFETFNYATGLRPLALLFMLIFLAGLAALLAGRAQAPKLTALLVISPFVVGFSVALFRVFPFAGSRHQTYLLPFLAAGISAAFAWVPRGRAVPILLLSAVVAPFWAIHSSPENDARVMPISAMTAAISCIGRTVPPGTPLFADDMTRDVLRYYLSRNDRALDIVGFEEGSGEWLGGHRFVIPPTAPPAFRPAEMVEQVTEAARMIGVPPGNRLSVVSVAWKEPSLASRLPAGGDREVKEFGRISLISIVLQKR
jgi:4-amino-4-deoxy-L-arabinose transferase-like glycosyltransferase